MNRTPALVLLISRPSDNLVGMSEETFDIHYVAKLARLNLTEEEFKTMGTQVAQILSYVEQLQSVELGDDVAPTAHPIPMTNVTRPDAVKPSLSQQEALCNAPAQGNDLFMVPKIVE